MGYVSKRMRHLLGKAVHEHRMIEDGDHVMVAVSGGKDSLSLLWLLRERLERIPISYRITAVHVDPGFGADSGRRLADFFQAHGFTHSVISTDIGPLAHSAENRENPCFLCARLRRKRLFETAEALGCRKIAFGHHKDDLIETFFLNLFYGASISTMMPVQPFFQGKVVVIRPLYLVDEDLIRRYHAAMNWPVIRLDCPTSGRSKREEVRRMLEELYRSNRKIKGNIFHAMHNVRRGYLP